MRKTMEKAIEILKNGGIAIFPTDTACAIGCRIDNEKAVERLFAIKGRSSMKATPVLVDGVDMAKRYAIIPEHVREALLNIYWPGALTVVFPCKTETVPKLVRGDGNTLGIRMPKSSVALQLISEVGVPIIGTSANFTGLQTPFDTADVNETLKEKVDIVIPGVCPVRQASTVIDITGTRWKIMRRGAVHLSL